VRAADACPRARNSRGDGRAPEILVNVRGSQFLQPAVIKMSERLLSII